MGRLIKRCGGVLLAVLLLMSVLGTPARPTAAQTKALDATYSDVVLVIDNSGSMRENDPNYLRLAAAKLFIDLADQRDRVGIVVLSGKGQTRKLSKRMLRIAEQDDLIEVKQQIDSIRSERMGDETHMGTALTAAYELLDSTAGQGRNANQRQFVLLLSDGKPTGAGQEDLVAQAAARFKERRYWKIFPIALGAEAAPDYLRQTIADPSGGEVIVAQHDTDLLNSYIEVYARWR